MRASKKTRDKNAIKGHLDDLAREACFDRDGHKCVRCPSRKVQWCHVIGRRHLATRWELDNNLSLCAGCHMFWHEYPSLSGPWFAKNWPERHEHILDLHNSRPGRYKTLKDLQELLEVMSTPPSKPVEPEILLESEIPF